MDVRTPERYIKLPLDAASIKIIVITVVSYGCLKRILCLVVLPCCGAFMYVMSVCGE